MDSSPRKASFTRLVLSAARRAPRLFPRHFSLLAESVPLHAENVEGNESLERASLFYDPNQLISLKGVNFVLEISSAELSGIQLWHRQAQLTWIDERHLDAIYSRGYLASPRENIIGLVSFDSPAGFQYIERVNAGAKLFHSCLISLLYLPSGSTYLNVFFWGGLFETSFVQRVSASHLVPTVEFQGYNLFRRSNLTASHFDRDGLADQMIRKGLTQLGYEARRNLTALFKRMDVKISSSRYLFAGWEFINDDDTLRFPDLVKGRKARFEHGLEFIAKSHKMRDFYGVKDQSLFLDLNDFGRENYDLLSVRSKRFDSFTSDYERDDFKQSGNRILDSIMIWSLIGNVHSKILSQRKALEREIGFLNKVSKVSKKQAVLFSVIESLSKVKDEVEQLKKYKISMCPEELISLYESRLEGFETVLIKILERAEREYQFINDRIGIQVVRSNARYSKVLGFFAVVQILLAYLAVDWEKQITASAFLAIAYQETRSMFLQLYGDFSNFFSSIFG